MEAGAKAEPVHDKLAELIAATSDEDRVILREMTKTPFMRVMQELNHVKDEARLVVIIAHGFIELMINTMIDRRCRNAKKITDDHRIFPHSAKLTLLNEMGVLSDHHYTLLNWFRNLRNDAAHKPFFKLTTDRLDVFDKPEHRDVSKFDKTCNMILIDLWKSHDLIIGPVLLPMLYKEITEDTLFAEGPGPCYAIPLKADPKTVVIKGEAAWESLTAAGKKQVDEEKVKKGSV
jgi:hypothetical protein